jgi:hypothetical protein
VLVLVLVLGLGLGLGLRVGGRKRLDHKPDLSLSLPCLVICLHLYLCSLSSCTSCLIFVLFRFVCDLCRVRVRLRVRVRVRLRTFLPFSGTARDEKLVCDLPYERLGLRLRFLLG